MIGSARRWRMRAVAIVSAAVVASVAFLAVSPGEVMSNPVAIEMMIDFDPPNMVNEIYPTPYTTFNAYLVADFTGLAEGTNMVAFRFDVSPEMGVVTGFTSGNPIIFITGSWDTGLIVTSTDCIDTFPATLGYLNVLYLGVPGQIRIEPHLLAGHVFATCDEPSEEYEYCYVLDGAVGMNGTEPRFICTNPVQDVTWGAIKTLYR
jgi:hypothetical protein